MRARVNDFSKTRPLFRSDAPPSSDATPGTSTSPIVGWARPQQRTPVRREMSPQALRRLNKCMFLEYDENEGRWRDALSKTGRGERAPMQLTPRREPERVRSAPLPPLPMVSAWENPLVVGLLLAVCPPVGVTLAWSARTIPQAGRVALTVFGAFVMLVATAVVGFVLL